MLKRKKFGAAALGVAGVLLLAACGSGGATAVSSPSATSSASRSGPGGRGGFRTPGVSGVITSRSGTTATVNATTGSSTTVRWTTSTPIVDQQQATAVAVQNGACVSTRSQGRVFGSGGGGASGRPSGTPSGRPSGARSPGSRPRGTFTLPSKLTATAVTIEPSSVCSTTGGRARSGGFGGFSGTVSGLRSTGFTMTVKGGSFGPRSSAGSATSSPTSTRKVAVTTSSSTTYTKDVSGSASSVRAGQCMTAMGTLSGSSLTAREITIAQSVNGSCDSAIGFRGASGGGSGASNG